MSDTVTASVSARHRLVPETGELHMAKADLRKPETPNYREQIGQCVNIARLALGWSLKEFAAKVAREERQVARWLNGQERVQLDVLWAIHELREPLLVALARLSGYAEVTTQIKFEKR